VRYAVPFVGFAFLALAGCDSCSKGSSTTEEKIDGAPRNLDPDASPVNATALPMASVAAMLNPDKLPAYTGPTGSIEGTITVRGLKAPATPADFHRCPDAEKTWGTLFREGEGRALADVVVAVTGYEGFYVPEKEEAKTLVIRDCAFEQRTLTLTYGQRIEVKNETKEFWTPILEPGPNMVLRMATPKGDPVRIYPKNPGHYILRDHDRRYSEVDVYAFLHPLHTATDLAGHYRIDGVPVGKLKVSARHPRIEFEKSVELEVKAAVIHKVDFVIDFEQPDAGKTYDAGQPYPGLR
jgi:hypothetical protein